MVPGSIIIIYFASKLGVTWEDAALVSLHGRKENLMAVIKENKKVFALVSNAEEIRQILTKMTEYGMGEVTVRIGTELLIRMKRFRQEQQDHCFITKERIWRSFILKMNPAAKAR